MKPIKGSYSIVIVGAWNPNIFNPSWLQKNLLKEGEEAEFAYPINDIYLPVQISIPDVKIYPSAQRLEIRLNNENSSNLENAIEVAKKIATLLQHTPVNGVGFNFSFVELEDIACIPSKFDLQDNAEIDSTKFKLKQTIIKRSYELDSKQSLNLAIIYNNNSVHVELNYHYDISDMCEAITILEKEVTSEKLAQATDFLRDVYKIEIDNI